jgi:hypothetical protein
MRDLQIQPGQHTWRRPNDLHIPRAVRTAMTLTVGGSVAGSLLKGTCWLTQKSQSFSERTVVLAAITRHTKHT